MMEFKLAPTTGKLSLIALLALGLGACDGGGVETVQNPFAGSGQEVAYQGPAPATADVRAFQVNVWDNLKSSNRCGQCHGDNGQPPAFANANDVNAAYSQAVPQVDLSDPGNSALVIKVGAGHNCWEAVDSVCADAIENMILRWAGSDGGISVRQIQLEAPVIKNPGDSKNFPANASDNGANSFENTIYPLLTEHCSTCHYEEGSSQQQAPFFANPGDVSSSYEAAKSKINIDVEENSRLVLRLLEGHNCWSDCGTQNPDTGAINGNAGEMLDAIIQFAGAISATAVDASLVTSKALQMDDGIIASGGNRHEANQIAIWEFKAGTGSTAFDTSGIEPAVNLNLSGNVSWLGSYGLNFDGGGARGDTQTSRKLHDFIRASGEYSIEAWVIPANVTQEETNIVGYDAGTTQKNFSLAQTLYNYNFHNRSDQSDAMGEPFLSTEDAGELLQSSLQHVVATYDPVEGRKIYLNGALVNVDDPITGSTLLQGWDDTFALSMGQNAAGSQSWLGQIRMAAVHNRVLTQAQAQQNFEVGVGQKYFLLFSVADHTGIDDSYIMFEVSQHDSYSYLFDQPTFINLDSDWTPGGFRIKGMRIGINGKEAVASQAFAMLDVSIDSSYDPLTGQLLSRQGTVIPLEKGVDDDEFFLTFEILSGSENAYTDPIPVPPTPPADADAVSDIGVRTFEEINATIATMTGIPVTNSAVDALYTRYQQQLPAAETIGTFLSSHQMAIAQLALTSCSELVDTNPGFFSGFNFSQTASNAFDTDAERRQIIDPLLAAAMNVDLGDSSNNLTTQPDETEIRNLLGATTSQDLDNDLAGDSYSSLMTSMQSCLPGCDTTARTEQIVKAVCGAIVGSAVMLIQ